MTRIDLGIVKNIRALPATEAASTPTQTIMAYSQKTIDAIMRAPKTQGNQLGRWAVHLNFSVVRIAKALGVSRQTVYNWFEGGEIFVAYEHRVETMLTYLKSSKTADEAWRKICQHYGLAP